jgi:hypothetical protein
LAATAAGAGGCDGRFDFDANTAGGGGAGSGSTPGGSASAGVMTVGGTNAAGSGGGAVAGSGGNLNGGNGSGGSPGGSSGSDAGGLAGMAGAAEPSSECSDGEPCPAPLQCVDGVCVECANDAHCTSYDRRPHCEITIHRCVECITENHCPHESKCARQTYHCVPECEEAGCPATAPICQLGVCQQCNMDAQCENSADGQRCASDGRGCVQCRGETDCPGQHCDDLSGDCVECRFASDCPSGLCDPFMHRCLTR